RRRLADIEGVEFALPSEGGTDEEEGTVTTESQQAAAFFNSMALPEGLEKIAEDLGVNVEDLDFGSLAFHQGQEVSILQEFDGGSVELSNAVGLRGGDDTDPGRLGTWILALVLAFILALAMALLCCCCRRSKSGLETKPSWADKPILKHFNIYSPTASAILGTQKNLATIHEEEHGSGDLDEDDILHEYDAEALVRVGRHGQKLILPRSKSVEVDGLHGRSESEDSGAMVGRFTYDNPMHRPEDTSSKRSYDDLAQHYDDSAGSPSAGSDSNFSEEGKVGNPMYEQPLGGGLAAPFGSRRNRDARATEGEEEEADWDQQRGWHGEHQQTGPGNEIDVGGGGGGDSGGGGHLKPPRIAVRPPPTYSRSFSEPELSPVAESDMMGRGESDLTSSGRSTGGGPGGIAVSSDADGRSPGRHHHRDGTASTFSANLYSEYS
ncbi:unnamed protein product, partial [Scytosiphon promiscuus]